MARYFFDTYDEDTVATDEIGSEFDNLEAVRDEAALALAELARDVFPGSVRRRLAVKVHDGQQPVLEATLTFEAIILNP
jgi:hypothetical protein